MLKSVAIQGFNAHRDTKMHELLSHPSNRSCGIGWALRSMDLQRALLEVEPEIVNFCGYGGGEKPELC
jgi:hypothetical protein